jgi:hypothetical protein
MDGVSMDETKVYDIVWGVPGKSTAPEPDPITVNGVDVEDMDRDELLAAFRLLAPMVVQLQAQADELRETMEQAVMYQNLGYGSDYQ